MQASASLVWRRAAFLLFCNVLQRSAAAVSPAELEESSQPPALASPLATPSAHLQHVFRPVARGMADAAAPVAAAPPDPALFFEPVAARDAVVTLTLPSNSDAVETEQTRTRGGKRRRSQAAAAARTVEHQVSAHQLQSASPKFR